MGADIHLCVEKINKSGEWEAVKRVIQEEVNYYEKKLKESEGKTYDYRAYYEERLKEAKEGSLLGF
ncbi:hypothetical protein ACFO25_19225 [Paenactinomyces guangxiensis]|uniref:Uncharacterized protein n=1 Tax=Paenactinomyces guangxiensis TaxID=1490290 RepID=A0A7W1WSV4_9BACL|nr:hypothetical protein [Paenactinomyces guangxiensis]MBA4495443.1 hypothetical protein [Paenactinomyces guangxiensis]MBH8592434.1 hypothetical protein [Paenactinomyces guangxiensis]